MIRYALICDQGHAFDAWFGSGAAYEDQERSHKVPCPCCGSVAVEKAPMAPAVKRSREELREEGIPAIPLPPLPEDHN